LGIIVALLEVMLDWKDQQSVEQDLPLPVQLFSQKPPYQQPSSTSAHQIAANPFHHLPMGLPDDNPSSFGDHYGSPGGHAGFDGLAKKVFAK
jgi:hypothetical protein